MVPYDLVWRSKITEYMERLEAGLLEASRAGYASSSRQWTIAGGLMYAASLTALTGMCDVYWHL